MTPASIRSIRNNNPGNIRVGQPWQGLMPRAQMTPAQAEETAFCVFLSPVWGFRAMAEIFHTYAAKDGVVNLAQAVHRWAPPGENNTDAYVNAVCDYTGYGPFQVFPFHGNPQAMEALLKAVSIHEAGGWYFEDADCLQGATEAH